MLLNLTYSIKLIQEEIKGTERENQGVGWDMSIPLKIFLTLNGKDVSIVSHCEFSLKKSHFPSFTYTKAFASTKLISTLSAILFEVSLNADVSENRLPLERYYQK